MTSLNDKTIIIIGAAGGLGRSHALACAQAGANLVLCDAGCSVAGQGHDPTGLDTLAEEVARLGAAPVCHHGRIEAPETCAILLDLAKTHFNQVDGLVWSAGVSRNRPLLLMSDEDLDAVLMTQVSAAIRVTRDVARVMSAGPGGSVVLTLGSTALLGAQHQANQAAAAGALAGFVRSAALDLRRHNVRVNGLAVLARTRVNADLPMFQRMDQATMTAAQISPTVLYLLSAASTHVSGEIVGAAGTRLYGIRVRDTPGYFFGETFDEEQVAGVFETAIRP